MFKLISIFNLDENKLQNLMRVVVLILLSSVKFVAGPFVVYFNQKYDFSFLKTNLFTIIGGMLGVTVVIYLSPYIMRFWYSLTFRSPWKCITVTSPAKRKKYFPPAAGASYASGSGMALPVLQLLLP